MNITSNREPETVEELKEAITNLAIETGQGLWKTVSFEEITVDGEEGWCASESVVGSGRREIIFCGLEGLKNSYRELVEYKAYIDSGHAKRDHLNSTGRSAEQSNGPISMEEGELE